jgi:ABC-2 type transport system permease protein
MRTFLEMTWVEIKLYLREPSAAFFTVVFPLLLLFIFGGIFGNEPSESLGGHGLVDLSVPGYIAMIMGTIGLLSIPVVIATYRENGVLRRFRATPLQSSVILASQVAVSLIMMVISTILLVVAARFIFDLTIPTAVFSLIIAITLASVSFFTLGFVLSGLVPSSRAATAVGMAVFFPMLFLSGAAMPRALFPDFMMTVSEFLPLTHAITLLQDLWNGNGWNGVSLAVIGGMLVVSLLVSARTFRWE